MRRILLEIHTTLGAWIFSVLCTYILAFAFDSARPGFARFSLLYQAFPEILFCLMILYVFLFYLLHHTKFFVSRGSDNTV